MPTPYQRARAAMRATHQLVALQRAVQPGSDSGSDEGPPAHPPSRQGSARSGSIDMAAPAQRSRQALRAAQAARQGGAPSSEHAGRSVRSESDMEEGLARARSRGAYSRQASAKSAREQAYQGHLGFSPPRNSFHESQRGGHLRDGLVHHDGPVSGQDVEPPMAEGTSPEESRVRWHRAVRNVVALNSMRPPPEPVPEEDGAESEEARKPAPGWISPRTDGKALLRLFTGSWMSLLLLAIPFGFAAHFAKWDSYAIFVLNIVGLVPLALVLGEVTEDLAIRFGDVIGGLLNATFGNVVELILSIAALTKGLYTVVAMSLIGSVLSNLLLVMGFCFLCGGSRYQQQSFNQMINKACCSLLFIASFAIVIPTSALQFYGPQSFSDTVLRNLSHAIAIILILLYLCYLLFQLKTHNSFFDNDDEEGAQQPALSLVAALAALAGITTIVAVASEFLTGALNDVAERSGLGQAFLGLIILPIAGNACEHITAVFVALKNKMDLAIGVALGSSIQIAIFVLPLMVLIGWAIGKPFLLNFEPFAAMVLLLSVIHMFFCSLDGNSNWLMGVELISTYLLIALLYLFIKETPSSNMPSTG